MDSETARVTPSEKTKLYLTKKLNEIEQKIKKTKKKKKILQIHKEEVAKKQGTVIF